MFSLTFPMSRPPFSIGIFCYSLSFILQYDLFLSHFPSHRKSLCIFFLLRAHLATFLIEHFPFTWDWNEWNAFGSHSKKKKKKRMENLRKRPLPVIKLQNNYFSFFFARNNAFVFVESEKRLVSIISSFLPPIYLCLILLFSFHMRLVKPFKGIIYGLQL